MSRDTGLDHLTVPTGSVENEQCFGDIPETDEEFFEAMVPIELLQDSEEDDRILISEILPAASRVAWCRGPILDHYSYPSYREEEVEEVGIVRFYCVHQNASHSFYWGVRDGQRYIRTIGEEYDKEADDFVLRESVGPVEAF